MSRFLSSLFILLFVASGFSSDQSCISSEEQKLGRLINAYRQSLGLPPVPLSRSLTKVARLHAADLDRYHTEIRKGCNHHSWSKHGAWKAVDYYSDHRNASGMWDKPRELTSYKSDGFEVVFYDEGGVTAQAGLDGWKKSVNHNNVIVNKGAWKDVKWNAMGVGVGKNFTCVWFGRVTDREGAPQGCL